MLSGDAVRFCKAQGIGVCIYMDHIGLQFSLRGSGTISAIFIYIRMTVQQTRA